MGETTWGRSGNERNGRTQKSITNNLLNSQSKFHNVLTGKKGFTEVTADDIFKKRKMVMAKRDDGSIFVVMQDDPGVS